MPTIRTERAEVLWAAESTFGTLASAPYARFGIHDTIEAPDPEFGWEPFFGVFSGRDRATILRGQTTLRGSIPDIRLQSGLTTFMVNHVLRPVAGTDELVDPFTLYIAYRDTGGSVQLGRYFLGGKVNRATVQAAEGQELRLSVDEMLFLSMQTTRNSGNDTFSASNPAADPGASATGRYLFASGDVTIAGISFPRVRRFALSIDNQLEPRHYVQRDGSTGLLHANDLVEGRRMWRLEVDVDIVNPASGGDLELWDFLINQGASGAGDQGATLGGQVVLTFNQAGSGAGSSTLTLTCGSTPSTTTPAGVLTAAPHSIPAPPAGIVPVTASFDIDQVTIATT
ncbi:hypothetical protein LCGC14_1496010 [marine sediment metagenome]|uniref:Uncharacterized protein n=1 Tax=marine sediment metagenome TaxID=412755 RepID=A0A0F9LL07_9ZZZZ